MAEALLTLKELCEELSISTATGRNWIKLGKLVPHKIEEKQYFFTKQQITKLKREMLSGKNNALKSRRNKKYVSGTGIYRSYLPDESGNYPQICNLMTLVSENKSLSSYQLKAILAEAAIQLILQREKIKASCTAYFLKEYLQGRLSLNGYEAVVDELLKPKDRMLCWIEEHPEYFSFSLTYSEKEDVLGLIYISCKNLGNRKVTGAYYTPTRVVNKLIHEVLDHTKLKSEQTICDPCCGTGNFLLQLPDDLQKEQVYGNDIDAFGIQIARINYALKFKCTDLKFIKQHITNKDYLFDQGHSNHDVLIGNPPWGYDFSVAEKKLLQKKFQSAKGKNVESFDVMTEQAILHLKENGVLAFVLPEAILSVGAHRGFREYLMKNGSIYCIEYLGNVFDQVLCPSIILLIKKGKNSFTTKGIKIKTENKSYVIQKERPLSAEQFCLQMTDAEYEIIEKMDSLTKKAFLKDHASFALGIVTGNNDQFLSDEVTKENEWIIMGTDLFKYQCAPSTRRIIFDREHLQQVAPEELYRAKEKLLYRFICNELVFSYDNEHRLSLNSANILIPEISGLDIKYVLAILNSAVVQFYYQMKFHSVKILRASLEQIPIPVPGQNEQKEIVELVDRILKENGKQNAQKLYIQIEEKVRALYNIKDEEFRFIQESISLESSFMCGK